MDGKIRFKLAFFVDPACTVLGLTLQEMSSNISVVKLKKLQLAEFLDDSTQLEDICKTVEEMIYQQGTDLLIDSETHELRADGITKLREFIESEF